MTDNIILYNTEDGRSQFRLALSDGTVWLSQGEMAALFETSPQNITQHIRTIYAADELEREATCKEYLQVQTEGERQIRRRIAVYRLEMVLAVGYRVRKKDVETAKNYLTDPAPRSAPIARGIMPPRCSAGDTKFRQTPSGFCASGLSDAFFDYRKPAGRQPRP